jgi:hypothetical protein
MNRKLQIVKARVRLVGDGFHTGFYLYGEGGTSKSFTVQETLHESKCPYKLTNTFLTPKGLFTLLRDSPNIVHVIEDAEKLFTNDTSHGLLRSALWGQDGQGARKPRLVTWHTSLLRDEFDFTSGIIFLANRRLPNVPALRAVESRIACLHFQTTDAEVAALMRNIALKGYRHGPHTLSSESCGEVVEAIIEISARLGRKPNLRLLELTYNERLHYENKGSETHWLDLLESRIQGLAPVGGSSVIGEQKMNELGLLRQVAGRPRQEQLDAWKSVVGKSLATFYRRLGELNGEDSHSQ